MLSIWMARSTPLTVLLIEIVVSMIIMKMPAISSTIRTLSTESVNFSLRSPRSS